MGFEYPHIQTHTPIHLVQTHTSALGAPADAVASARHGPSFCRQTEGSDFAAMLG